MEEVKSYIRGLVVAGIVGIGLGLISNYFLFSMVYADGVSMEKTIEHGEKMVVQRIGYNIGVVSYKHGDVVVLDAPKEDKKYIKRVIAVAGDELEIREGKVYINGAEIQEDYIDKEQGTYGNERIKVGEGQVYVMGDNRGDSYDSRAFGSIETGTIMGKAVLRVWPRVGGI